MRVRVESSGLEADVWKSNKGVVSVFVFFSLGLNPVSFVYPTFGRVISNTLMCIPVYMQYLPPSSIYLTYFEV